MKKKLLILLFLTSCVFSKNITIEVEHFIFNGDEKDLSEEIINFCEEYYNKFSLNLSKELDKKIMINIYPEMEIFHDFILKKFPGYFNKDQITDFFICVFDKQNNIYVISPYNPGKFHCFSSVKASIVANIEKKFLLSFYDLPNWMLDSIFCFRRWEIMNEIIDNTDSKKRSNESFQRVVKDENNFKISNLNNNYDFLVFQKEYITTEDKEGARNRGNDRNTLKISFVKFVIDNYGYKYLLEMNKNISEVFTITSDEFEKKWFDFTRKSINN